MSGKRSSRSAASPRRTTSSTAWGNGRSGVDSGGGGGGAAAADSELWEYGGRPLSIRNVSAARENWSARASRCSPCACSGATNDGVPAIIVSRDDTSSAFPRPEVTHHGPDDGALVLGVDGAEQHVGRLDVAMEHAALVEGVQPRPDLPHHLAGLRHGQSLVLEPIGQRALVGVRHHQVGPVVLQRPRVVHGDDVRGLHLAEEAALLEEALADVGVLGPVLREHLDRNRGVELLVISEPDGREAAGADAPTYGVATEAGRHGHGRHYGAEMFPPERAARGVRGHA